MKNITLTLRVTPQRAISILNRLYGCGEINRAAWSYRVAALEAEIARQEAERKEKSESLVEKSGTFYKNLKKTPPNRGQI